MAEKKLRSISQEKVKSLFSYSSKLGGLVYKKRHGRTANYMHRVPGTRAGFTHSRGYRHVAIGRIQFKEHILVWIYFYGTVPKNMQIDHKNGVRDDNRISNLRLATSNNNQHNRGKNKNNSSGFKGVYWHQNKWKAVIMVNRKTIVIGSFDNAAKAGKAYDDAAKKLHGKYAKTNAA